MFSLCESMKWNHLPVAGGLYEQDPDLLVGFQYIFSARADYQEKKQAEEEAKARNPSTGASPRRR